MKTGKTEPAVDHPIVFFDGVCGMCNRFVDVVVRADVAGVFHFAPLQGETARAMLPAQPADAMGWSMVYLDEKGVHQRSDASLEVLRRLGGGWWLLSLLRYVPRFIRDPIYRIVARYRYRVFGRRDACRVPSEAERERFLP